MERNYFTNTYFDSILGQEIKVKITGEAEAWAKVTGVRTNYVTLSLSTQDKHLGDVDVAYAHIIWVR